MDKLRIIIALVCIFFVLGLLLYFAIDNMIVVNIIRNPEKTLSTMSVEKAKIINYEHKDKTNMEFQISNSGKTFKRGFSKKYDAKINDEVHIIYNKKVFGDYIIIECIKSYEYEMELFFIWFFVMFILLLYPIYKLIRLYFELKYY
jgi:hypothetical protein